MNLVSLLIFAILPSFLWLLYYFKKDIHPEPKRLILYVFIAGAVFAIIGYFFQKTASFFLLSIAEDNLQLLSFLPLLYTFVIVAFSEELLKYLAFFFTIKDHSELDEPVDIIIYMITAALGFAALENFIILFTISPTASELVQVSGIRFLSGTLLHVLASGILGGFLVYSYRLDKKYLAFVGLLTVSVMHGFYNLIAGKTEESILFFFALLFFFIIFALILSIFIKKAGKMKSICLLK